MTFLFFAWLHFELARLAAVPTVDSLQVERDPTSRINDFGDSKSRDIIASRPKCNLFVARGAPAVNFADSIQELSILRLRKWGAHL